MLTLHSASLEVDVCPGVGGSILQIRALARGGLPLLYETPWGLRARGALQAAGTSEDLAMDAYPGGWQSAFPNGGPGSVRYGATWTQHGEAWHAPFDHELIPGGVRLTTRLVRSPFHITRDIVLAELPDGAAEVRVAESIINAGGEEIVAVWGQHPAIGPPFLSPAASISTTAETWIGAEAEGGVDVDDFARVLEPPTLGEPGTKRFGFFADFPGERGLVRLTNPELALAAEVDFSLDPHRYAWCWMEAGAARGFPYYSSAYVLGLEPFSGYPGGIDQIEAGGRLITFVPGERRTGDVAVRIVNLATERTPEQ